MKKFLLLCFSFVFASFTILAQDRVISGKVTSLDDGSTLPGVNVVLKGTTNGAVSDSDGNYKISVPASGGVLVFSFIGFKSAEAEVGDRTTVDIQMAQDIQQLSEVVVTALGIKREVKSLTYATQTVNSDMLNLTRANNVNDALAGKVAGVQVRGQSGAALGRNSTLRIRGAGSLTDKEPLYIIDGTPVTNSADFNPDDIESMNVLKGPAATALYGQRGDAGVILLTTKKGTKGKGIGININQNMFFDKVYILPQYQNDYAGGSSADLIKFTYKPGMPAEWLPLDGEYYHDYTDDASWGPRMVGQQYIPWYAWAPGTKYTGKTTALVGQPDNIRDFYRTGSNRITNVALSGANDNASIRLSYTNQGQEGIMPNTSLAKNTMALTGSMKLNKWVTFGANINYVNTVITGEFDDAYANQTSGSFNQWFHRNLDMKLMKELGELKSPEGRLVSWNHFNPDYYVADSDNDGVINGDKFYRGFYWYNHGSYMNLVDYETNRDRLFGDMNVTFNIMDNLKAAVFYRKNQNTTFSENKRPSILPYSYNVELRPNAEAQYDYYGTSETFFKEDNLEFLATYNSKALGDKLSFDISAGGNLRMEKTKNLNLNTSLGLVVPDLYTIQNSKNPNFGYGDFRSRKEVRSIYAFGNVGYNETFYLSFSARNDWSSALPVNANSYFYPSIGGSFVFSELTSNVLPFLTYGKLRATWAQVGSDLAAYQTALTYAPGANQWSGNIVSGTPNTLVDPNIEPSLSSSLEFGLDLKFLQNRASASFTYVDESKINEILSVGVSGASGFTNKLINAGQIDRKVFEIQLEGSPIKTPDFTWNVTFNFAKINSKIVELSEGVDAIAASTPLGSGGTSTGVSFGIGTTWHVVGQEWGQLRGSTISRDGQGRPVLDANGLYIPTDDPVDFGSIMPDFTGGFINNFSYKNFNLAFNIDFQKGGKFYSLSDQWGTYSGLTTRTAALNDLGNPVRDNIADGGGVHVVGVDEGGSSMDTYVPAQDYYHQFYNSGIADPSIFDLTYVKLREINLSYQIPISKLGLSKVFTSASVGVIGRNLWLIYSGAQDFDPSEIASGFGENGQFPSIRSYGFNIKLGF